MLYIHILHIQYTHIHVYIAYVYQANKKNFTNQQEKKYFAIWPPTSPYDAFYGTLKSLKFALY